MLLTSRTFGENLILAWAAFTESPAVLIFTLTDSSCPKPSWPDGGATLKSAAHAELTENIWTRMMSMRGRVVEVMGLEGMLGYFFFVFSFLSFMPCSSLLFSLIIFLLLKVCPPPANLSAFSIISLMGCWLFT